MSKVLFVFLIFLVFEMSITHRKFLLASNEILSLNNVDEVYQSQIQAEMVKGNFNLVGHIGF